MDEELVPGRTVTRLGDAKALRAYWREIRDREQPTRSPALNALDTLSFMGRQANMNLVFIGQRLSVAASGGDGDSRENIGTIALGRYSPSNWRMMAPDLPLEPAPRKDFSRRTILPTLRRASE